MKDASKNVRGIKKWNALFEKIMRVIWRCNNPEDGKKKELEAILQKMIEADAVLLEWSDELWLTLIDECVAHVDKTITFKFKNGYETIKQNWESVIRADFLLLLRIQINGFMVKY